MTEPMRPSGPMQRIARADFPLISTTMAATTRSSLAVKIPVGSSLIRFMWNSNSNPSLITFTEAFSINGVYRNVYLSSNNSTIAAVKPFGNSTSIAGAALVPDLAGSRFVKCISSKTNGNARNFYFVCAG